MKNQSISGFSLIEVMIALGISSLLLLLLASTTGINLISAFVPGQIPTPQLMFLAERRANLACVRSGTPEPVAKCFKDQSQCIPFFKGVFLTCFMDVKEALPPHLTQQDEEQLLRISSSCFLKVFRARVAKHPEYFINSTCLAQSR